MDLHKLQEMKTQNDIQAALLAAVAAKLPPHISLVDDLASLLDVSRDSAYRRLRGETELSLRETQLICTEYGLSLDALMRATPGLVRFHQGPGSMPEMEDRLATVNAFLTALEKAKQVEITYFSMELPFFHILQVPELFAFKQQYWHSMLHPETALPLIQLDNAPATALHLDIVNRYLRLPSTEIIYESALHTTMMQILYFLESGHFAEPKDALRLFDSLKALATHLKEQAVLGRKFKFGTAAPTDGPNGTYRLFLNEMVYSQNIICTQADGHLQVFLEYNVVNFLRTDDPAFCGETVTSLQTIQSKSIPISTVSERERSKFFHRLQASIDRMRHRAEMLIAGE
jgi:hypothetical protein